MKKLLLLTLTAITMVGCDLSKQELGHNLSADGYILKEIDSCEYFMVHLTNYTGGGGFLPVHKNNCKFCAERRKQELKELIEQLKDK